MIRLSSLRESIQENFEIQPEYQVFYFNGQIVYQIDTSIVTEDNILSVRNIQDNCLVINFNLKILEQSFLISVENYKNYTLLDALFILVQTFDVKIVFQRNIAITNSEFEFLELNCSLNDIRDREELIITSATSGPQIEFIAKLISEDKKFAFNQDTKVKDLIYILSLYYEIDYRRFRASTPINTIDNLELTIIENGIYSDSLLILDILKTGGGKNYSKVKFLNVQTGTIANNQNSGAPQ